MPQLAEKVIPGALRSEDESERHNAAIHLVSIGATKFADGLIDPKLVLAWLFSALGAPAYLIGALVPVREAGALLPQLLLAPRVAASPQRKLFWSGGSALQGLAALGIGLAALTLEGALFGWVALGLLAVLALARALCSVSYKDALARTIPKTRRGGISGAAGSLASALVIGFGAALATGLLPLDPVTIALTLCVAGGLWLVGAGLFLRLDEPDSGSGGETPLGSLFSPLRTDPQLRLFILTRAILTVTALAPPFLVALSSAQGERSLGQLGPLVLASAFASILSAWVWGRLSDISTRRTLMASAALAALVFAICAAWGWTTGGLGGVAGAAAAIFAAQIAYEGVRSGRKIHLTDMVGDENRARYTAISNTLIGVVLLAGSAFGVIAEALSIPVLLALFAALCAVAVGTAARLDEVQQG